MSVCAKLKEGAEGVGFLVKTYFSLQQRCRFLAYGCQNLDIDLKFKMEGRINPILMCVKNGDDLRSSLDFSFVGGCTLKLLI